MLPPLRDDVAGMRDNPKFNAGSWIDIMGNGLKSGAAAALVALACATPRAATQPDLPLERIRLPSGFVIETVARVPDARGMTWGERGTLFVGSTEAGKIYALTLTDSGATVRIIASGLREPAGVAFRDGALYVSAVSRILRFDGIERRLDQPPQPIVVNDAFPTDGHHGR